MLVTASRRVRSRQSLFFLQIFLHTGKNPDTLLGLPHGGGSASVVSRGQVAEFRQVMYLRIAVYVC